MRQKKTQIKSNNIRLLLHIASSYIQKCQSMFVILSKKKDEESEEMKKIVRIISNNFHAIYGVYVYCLLPHEECVPNSDC